MSPTNEIFKNGKNQKKTKVGPVESHAHPDHAGELVRLKRIKGQVEGLEKMISDRRYCPDIILQIRAARAALLSLENAVMNTHIRHCVKDAFRTRDSFKTEEKIQEIIELVSR